MNIENLNMLEVGKKMEACLADYFTEYTVSSDTNGIFSEVIRLAHDEINHLLIQPENVQLSNGDKWFNGASGIIELSNASSGLVQTYTVMLVMNEPQTKALYLYVSKWDAATQDDNEILIRDFTQGGDI